MQGSSRSLSPCNTGRDGHHKKSAVPTAVTRHTPSVLGYFSRRDSHNILTLLSQLYLGCCDSCFFPNNTSSPPPTKANRVPSPAGSPDFRKWESYRRMPLVDGFSRGSPVSFTSSFRRLSIFTPLHSTTSSHKQAANFVVKTCAWERFVSLVVMNYYSCGREITFSGREITFLQETGREIYPLTVPSPPPPPFPSTLETSPLPLDHLPTTSTPTTHLPTLPSNKFLDTCVARSKCTHEVGDSTLKRSLHESCRHPRRRGSSRNSLGYSSQRRWWRRAKAHTWRVLPRTLVEHAAFPRTSSRSLGESGAGHDTLQPGALQPRMKRRRHFTPCMGTQSNELPLRPTYNPPIMPHRLQLVKPVLLEGNV
ncbi:hypothetical protein PR048_027357 [Dryococelus australis]|uniref:Uncharacterized protein n=1 Tax=Dryococelus australis TaxID=614101 RepID=A0ABQ9GFE4_9NEOP|nr:hypothetical protein PR048_027357 [Dryococelus australis]